MGMYRFNFFWLASALATYTAPSPFAIFDVRFGWLVLPKVANGEPKDVNVQIDHPQDGIQKLEISLAKSVLEPFENIIFPEIAKSTGIVMSGKLPRWYFAALSRYLMGKCAWLGIFEPRLQASVVVWSKNQQAMVGGLFC